MTYNGVDLLYAKDIHLPSYDDFKNLKSAKKLAIDIGGSLVKIVYLSEVEYRRKRLNSFSSVELSTEHSDNETNKQQCLYTVEEKDHLEERLYFKKFETKYIDEGLKFIKENLLTYYSNKSNKILHATGGGAVKYKDLIEATLDVKVEKEDEITSLINGCNFLLKHLPNESFMFNLNDDEIPELKFQDLSRKEFFPYLLVNIGSGVSIIKVEGINTYERIGGTSTGGGTFWGLGSLLTDAKGFDELLEMAIDGKTKNVDMLVKDIYGGGYDLMKLPAELVASSFGKACRSSGDTSGKDHTANKFRPQDIAKALLRMISNDIGQISSLYAQVHNLSRIIFAGYFIRGHPVTMQTMSYAVRFFSKGSQQALFMRHEGYLGAIGAFLASAASIGGSSWSENYAAMIAAENKKTEEKVHKIYDYDTFELDRVEKSFDSCPLLVLSENTYADFINLGTDKEAREYWLEKLEYEVDLFTLQAIESQGERKDSKIRGSTMKETLLKRLNQLREFPFTLGRLTIHSLVEMRQQFLNLFDFNDVYLKRRQNETESALLVLENYLKTVDTLQVENKEEELVTNMLAGNIFDWNTSVYNPALVFDEVKCKMQKRPWLHDDFDEWKANMTMNGPYKNVIFFVDNSGVDIVLGVFPYIRHLLQQGSKIILAANSGYSKNDILHQELLVLADRVAETSPIVNTALKSGALCIMESGSCSQCLQLRTIENKLVQAMKDADLIILEGVDRAIYTNYEEKFSCDSLRFSVIEDPWTAEKLGGKKYDIIFKFEKGNDADK